jgi:hypothetical protein
VAFAWWHRV